MKDDYILTPCQGVSMYINARERNLGDFTVKRYLPHDLQRKVGPFVFFDHMGPVDIAAGQGIDIHPHPHVCLATITYLFTGSLVHRDSLGYVQEILPGEVNWMTAGRGIVHSERAGETDRANGQSFHGLQVWVALPEDFEEVEPEFRHYERENIPRWQYENCTMRLIAGTAYGRTSPVRTYSRLFYVDVEISDSGQLRLPDDYSERGIYLISGTLNYNGVPIEAGTMVIFNDNAIVEMRASRDSRLVMFGGDPLTERYLEWNFVASTRERIERARDDWINGRFPVIPDDAGESIPYPREA